MLAAIFCLTSFVVTLWAGKRSFSQGLLAVMAAGYFYGILRANLPSTASHFLFDSSLIAFYFSQQWSTKPGDSVRTATIQTWTTVLIAWPCLLSMVPFQSILVTLVGLRGNILFLPLIWFGSRLRREDLRSISLGLAVLNLIALGFGLAEYFAGIERFFPKSEVTAIIYASQDVGGGAYRIPSTFLDAHAYGGTMALTIPLLFGAWTLRDQGNRNRMLLMLGILAALLGVLLSATRVSFLLAAALVVIALVSSGVSVGRRISWAAALSIIAVVTLGNDRLQRFTTLNDTKMIDSRINGSVNSGFWDMLHDYPLGNGLGGGGTSMPYFLQNQVRNQIGMENEYARLLAEQGFIGLTLWAAFICWFLLKRSAFQRCAWRSGRIVAWFACALSFANGLIGLGLLSAVPGTSLILLLLGWVSTPALPEKESKGILATTIQTRPALTSTFSA